MARIMVVDDDIDFLTQMQVQLEADGHEVVTAESPAEAEERLAERAPDLAVLDLMMENMDDGFVLAHRVKKLDSSIPVIIVTAVTSETGMEFTTAGADERAWIKADAVLDKPVRFEQLQREIKRLLKE
jgi:CheY-like chemotaxis protein